jgi:hypothetical protein
MITFFKLPFLLMCYNNRYPKDLQQHVPATTIEGVLLFLDYYFTFEAQFAPEGHDKRTCNLTFKELYTAYYLDFCAENKLTIATLPQFYRVRYVFIILTMNCMILIIVTENHCARTIGKV